MSLDNDVTSSLIAKNIFVTNILTIALLIHLSLKYFIKTVNFAMLYERSWLNSYPNSY